VSKSTKQAVLWAVGLALAAAILAAMAPTATAAIQKVAFCFI
jgi:hypothetical protein